MTNVRTRIRDVLVCRVDPKDGGGIFVRNFGTRAGNNMVCILTAMQKSRSAILSCAIRQCPRVCCVFSLALAHRRLSTSIEQSRLAAQVRGYRRLVGGLHATWGCLRLYSVALSKDHCSTSNAPRYFTSKSFPTLNSSFVPPSHMTYSG
jgi:hypothetical protein